MIYRGSYRTVASIGPRLGGGLTLPAFPRLLLSRLSAAVMVYRCCLFLLDGSELLIPDMVGCGLRPCRMPSGVDLLGFNLYRGYVFVGHVYEVLNVLCEVVAGV